MQPTDLTNEERASLRAEALALGKNPPQEHPAYLAFRELVIARLDGEDISERLEAFSIACRQGRDVTESAVALLRFENKNLYQLVAPELEELERAAMRRHRPVLVATGIILGIGPIAAGIYALNSGLPVGAFIVLALLGAIFLAICGSGLRDSWKADRGQ